MVAPLLPVVSLVIIASLKGVSSRIELIEPLTHFRSRRRSGELFLNMGLGPGVEEHFPLLYTHGQPPQRFLCWAKPPNRCHGTASIEVVNAPIDFCLSPYFLGKSGNERPKILHRFGKIRESNLTLKCQRLEYCPSPLTPLSLLGCSTCLQTL